MLSNLVFRLRAIMRMRSVLHLGTASNSLKSQASEKQTRKYTQQKIQPQNIYYWLPAFCNWKNLGDSILKRQTRLNNWGALWINHAFLYFIFLAVPCEEPIWCLDKEVNSGHMFWRRDSSKVKFRCEVEVLEFERDPEEELWLTKKDFNYSFLDQSSSNPIVVISTCICAIAVTVLLPWLMVGVNEPIE